MIDLRSDTVTEPTEEMRRAMAEAVVGDDVYGDDETMNRLEKRAAEIMHKEAALFVPSGTMGNLLSILTHTRPADEIITGWHNHILTHEAAGIAQFAGVMPREIQNADDRVYGSDIEKAVRPDDIHEPRSSLVCLENALSNGTVIELEVMKDAYDAAKKHDLSVHLDGARIFNAAQALHCEAWEIAQYADSVMFCLSKGLCAPIGSMIVSTQEFIDRARRNRKRLGGGMRQAGILAAAGLIAIEKMTDRLSEDHDNAQYLKAELMKLPGCEITSPAEINMVFFQFHLPQFDEEDFAAYLTAHGIKNNGSDKGVFRFVTHHGISRGDCETVMQCVRNYFEREK